MYNLLTRLSPDHLDLLVLQDTPVLREMLVPQVTLELPAPLASPDPLVLTAPLVTLVLKEVRQQLHFFFKNHVIFFLFFLIDAGLPGGPGQPGSPGYPGGRY